MKKQKKQKKWLALAALLAVVTLVAGTFAWLTAQDSVINRMSAGKTSTQGVKVTETWTPEDITPGAVMTKKVAVENKTTGKYYVRVSYEEVLKYLVSKGTATTTTTPYVPLTADSSAVAKAGLARDLAVTVDPAVDYAGFDDITSKFPTSGAGALPTGVKAVAKGSYTVNASTGEATLEKEINLYYPYEENGTNYYQKMDSTVTITTKDFVNGQTAADWTYSLTNASYYVYSGGYAFSTVNWAKSNQVDYNGTSVTGASLLGTAGSRYGKDYDYRNQTNLGVIPDANLSITATPNAEYPTDSTASTKVLSDSALGSLISLNYATANIVDPTGTLSAGQKWVYNPEDGWFYYLQPLEKGTTPELLQSVAFSSAINKEFDASFYDLIVKTEAVVVANEALTDSSAGGFGLVADNPTDKPISAKIYNVLKK